MAERVMRMPEPGQQLQVKKEEEKAFKSSRCSKPLVQRRVANGDVGEEVPAIVGEVLRSPGQPLDPGTRAFMESRLGHDFGQVRIHADGKAAETTKTLHAAAYTLGRDVVFANGLYTPRSHNAYRLLAHELAHVVQQGAAVPLHQSTNYGLPAISRTGEIRLQYQRLLVHGSGFNRPTEFRSDAEELRCGQSPDIRGDPDCRWFPSTVDYAVLAQKSGGSVAAATIDELLQLIERQPVGSIHELGIIGHANGRFFALGGEITRDNISFAEPAMIGRSGTFLSAIPQLIELRNRFAPDARVTLFACGDNRSPGTGGESLDLMSRALMRCVAGFKREIQVGLKGDTLKEMDSSGAVIREFIPDNARITHRGKVYYSSATLAFEEFGGAATVPILEFHDNVFEMKPDMLSCFGAQASVIEKTIAEAEEEETRITGTRFVWWFSPADRAVRAAQNILERHFSEEKVKVDTVKYVELTAGVKVEPIGKGSDMKGRLSVGAKFLQRVAAASQKLAESLRIAAVHPEKAEKIRSEIPKSLKIPTEEIEWALRVIDRWRAGLDEPRTVERITLP